MRTILIKNALIVNEGKKIKSDLLISDGKIEKIGTSLTFDTLDSIIDAEGLLLLPGVIDDQVHFREPGLIHKATIYSEAKAAVAGGITSFMEMPNTVPQTIKRKLLDQKFAIAAENSLANYSFFMGATNDNLQEILQVDPKTVCGVKIFMGSSTGNMLVDNEEALERIFAECKMLIATHCEDEETIKANSKTIKEQYGDNPPVSVHPIIRNEEACYKSSSMAVKLAEKHNTRLHVLHISTAKECELFKNDVPLKEKRITAEACIHHLWFDDTDYEKKGKLIKWNPAVKDAKHKEAIMKGLLENRIDIIATDHAPHTKEEKNLPYFQCPSGAPMVQHALVTMLELSKQGKLPLEKVVEKMCHAPADCFQIEKRGYIREGYWADLVLVNPDAEWTVSKENLFYMCGWSPLEGTTFHHKITHTFVSGHLAYEHGVFDESQMGMRLLFER
jgi:dihydroorotase